MILDPLISGIVCHINPLGYKFSLNYKNHILYFHYVAQTLTQICISASPSTNRTRPRFISFKTFLNKTHCDTRDESWIDTSFAAEPFLGTGPAHDGEKSSYLAFHPVQYGLSRGHYGIRLFNIYSTYSMKKPDVNTHEWLQMRLWNQKMRAMLNRTVNCDVINANLLQHM